MHIAVGCSKAKANRPAPPAALYTGSFHRACVAAALAVVSQQRLWVVSALYGLVAYDIPQQLAPYDVAIRDAPGIRRRIRRQVRTLSAPPFDRIGPGDTIAVLAGRRYADALEPAFHTAVQRPLGECIGIGAMRRRLAMIRRTGHLDARLQTGGSDGRQLSLDDLA